MEDYVPDYFSASSRPDLLVSRMFAWQPNADSNLTLTPSDDMFMSIQLKWSHCGLICLIWAPGATRLVTWSTDGMYEVGLFTVTPPVGSPASGCKMRTAGSGAAHWGSDKEADEYIHLQVYRRQVYGSGSYKVHMNKAHRNKTQRNKTKRNKTQRNKTHMKKTHRNKRNKTQRNKTQRNKTQRNKTQKKKTQKNKTHMKKTQRNKTHRKSRSVSVSTDALFLLPPRLSSCPDALPSSSSPGSSELLTGSVAVDAAACDTERCIKMEFERNMRRQSALSGIWQDLTLPFDDKDSCRAEFRFSSTTTMRHMEPDEG
ncbi:hypothetical protein EYF80_049866 [Liparis tanakae]|uniref:Uncharacterized protein n=1 Tax=Liparis tanakae TaxID=230148 RepID=A0A4Z2FFL7_9TELE|nr:hypothetical protein EYF80_049866 [Liparis tanakae]